MIKLRTHISTMLLATICSVSAAYEANTSMGAHNQMIGVVDLQTLFQSDSAGKMERLQKSFQEQQEKLVVEQEKLENDALKLEKDGATMTQNARLKEENNLRQRSEALSAKRSQATQDYYKSEQSIRKAFMDSVNNAAIEVAQSQGITLIIPADIVLYGDVRTDVTDAVQAKMR